MRWFAINYPAATNLLYLSWDHRTGIETSYFMDSDGLYKSHDQKVEYLDMTDEVIASAVAKYRYIELTEPPDLSRWEGVQE